MQHLDEGTIHAWLDGALNPDEAARVEAHVKECAQCAAAVAEARGFIAASSRILTALDNAPRGVIPATAPKKRFDSMVWRIAATVLVVAAGTLVVVRNQNSPVRSEAVTSAADTALSSAATAMAAAPMTTQAAASAAGNNQGTVNAAPPRAVGLTSKRIANSAAPRQPEQAAAERSSRSDVARGGPAFGGADAAQANQKAMAREAAPAATRTPMLIAPSGVAGVAMMDQAKEAEPLKVVGTPRRIGARVTLYEIAPGDTVTLTEPIALSLESVVVTGAGTTRMMPQSAGKAAAAPAKQAEASPTTTSDSRPVVAAPSAAAPASAVQSSQVRVSGATNSISWVDRVTGNTLTLTGRMSTARLQEIKARIERERAAAAANKKP